MSLLSDYHLKTHANKLIWYDMLTWRCMQRQLLVWNCYYFYKAVVEEKANGGRPGDWWFFELSAGDGPNELLELRAWFGVVVNWELGSGIGWFG